MRRVAITGMFYFMLMNATAVVLDNIGFTDELGVSVELTASKRFTEASEKFDEFEMGGGFLDTLFGIFDAVFSVMGAVLHSLYAGPQMLIQLGFPSEIVGPFEIIVAFIIGLAALYYASGRD